MKMVYITCNISVKAQVTDLLEAQNIRDYQIIDEVTVKNKIGPPRFNNSVWPGYNAALLMQISEPEKIERLMQALRDFNRNAFNKEELVVAATWPMEDYIYGNEYEGE